MKQLFDNIERHVNESGEVRETKSITNSIIAAESLGERLLGSTLVIRQNRFIIKMLELYYGGVGDDGHDWYRTRFEHKKSKKIEHTKTQELEGFRIYLSSLSESSRYTRFDIVVGHDKVPISFLVRSVWDSDFNLIGSEKGSPNVILKKLALMPADHNSLVDSEKSCGDFCIEDTHEKIINEKGFSISRSKRINLNSKFEEKHNLNWNFTLR